MKRLRLIIDKLPEKEQEIYTNLMNFYEFMKEYEFMNELEKDARQHICIVQFANDIKELIK